MDGHLKTHPEQETLISIFFMLTLFIVTGSSLSAESVVKMHYGRPKKSATVILNEHVSHLHILSLIEVFKIHKITIFSELEHIFTLNI